jgi:hypothetical protein
MKLNFGKKGSVMDPITVGSVILTCAITIFVMMYFWGAFDTAIRESVSGSVANESVTGTLDELTIIYSYLDYGIPLLVGGLMIVSLVLAFKTGAGIIYAFLSVIAWAFALLMSAVYTNVFEMFAVNFPAVAANYPILVFIMANMKWIVLAWVFLISLIMFTRNKKEDVQFDQGMQQLYG